MGDPTSTLPSHSHSCSVRVSVEAQADSPEYLAFFTSPLSMLEPYSVELCHTTFSMPILTLSQAIFLIGYLILSLTFLMVNQCQFSTAEKTATHCFSSKPFF